MRAIILMFIAFCCVVTAFKHVSRPVFARRVLYSTKKHETQLEGNAPYGRQFFAADVGVPTYDEEFGGGDVGGNDYKDALFHAGPRGKNKPKITDVAVVKLPDMRTVERGFKDYRNPDGTMASEFKGKNFKTGPWTKEEDAKLIELMKKEKDGVRGRWVRIASALGRSTADCNSRWSHNLAPPHETQYPNILYNKVDNNM